MMIVDVATTAFSALMATAAANASSGSYCCYPAAAETASAKEPVGGSLRLPPSHKYRRF